MLHASLGAEFFRTGRTNTEMEKFKSSFAKKIIPTIRKQKGRTD